MCEEVIPFSVAAAIIVAILQSHPRLRFRPDKYLSALQYRAAGQQACEGGYLSKEYARISRVGASRFSDHWDLPAVCVKLYVSTVLVQSLASISKECNIFP